MKAAALCASGWPACLSALLRIGVHLAFWLLANEFADMGKQLHVFHRIWVLPVARALNSCPRWPVSFHNHCNFDADSTVCFNVSFVLFAL